MFAFHETTRKYVCRAAFIALCVAPTFFTACWIAGRHWPGRKGRVARELSELLDVHVKLAEWREPRPQVIRTHGIAISDPASAHLLAELKTLEASFGGVRGLVIDELTIEASQLENAAKRLFAWMSKLPPAIHEIQCGKLHLRLVNNAAAASKVEAAQVFTLYRIRGRIDRDTAGRPTVHLVGCDEENPTSGSPNVKLALTPSNDTTTAAPSLTLETVGIAIPVQVLGFAAPGFDSLGEGATFRGIINWTLAQPESLGAAEGRLDGVALSALLPAGSPHTLNGVARIDLHELTWRGGRIERIGAAATAAGVHMSRSLVDAAANAHGFQCRQSSSGAQRAGEPSLLAVDLLAVDFQLDANGLTFSGNCPTGATGQPGCIAVSGEQPLLIEPPYPGYKWPLGVLFQTLSSRPAAWMPATRAAVDQASRLPLPVD